MKRTVRLAISRQSVMKNQYGTPIHYYEIYNQEGAGISIGISNIDNPDGLAQAFCDSWNMFVDLLERPN